MSARGTNFEVQLQPLADADRVTTCNIQLLIRGVAVWPAYNEASVYLEVQIDDLLGYLTDFWKPLMLRQVYPIDVNPSRPSGLRAEAERRWENLPSAVAEREDEIVTAFEEAHDLSRAFAGIYGLPPLWLMRSGANMLIDNGRQVWQLPFQDVRASLSEIGDQICNRLMKADADRWGAASEAWHMRDQGDQIGLLAWSTGLRRSAAEKLVHDGVLTSPVDFDDAANDNDELRIAARMAGALPNDQIRKIVSIAQGFASIEAGDLRALGQEVSAYLVARYENEKPFHQGAIAARYVREALGLVDGEPVDIFGIAAKFEIDVRNSAVKPESLAGLAVWGSRHGPGVFLNRAFYRTLKTRKQNIADSWLARVTLAHELCHLLLDAEHPTTAVEVLRARMPASIERRAKSFAGEFLLPAQVAVQYWFQAGRPTKPGRLESVLDELTRDFGVTKSVAAWKLEHGADAHDHDLSSLLDAIVPTR